MMKRERDELLDRGESGGNGNKIQRVTAQYVDGVPEDPKPVGLQDAGGNAAARKLSKIRANALLKGKEDHAVELGHEIYREGRRYKFEGSELPKGESATLLVRIPVEHLQPHNRQVKARQLWGVDVYTHDSDVVAVLMHCGFLPGSGGVPRDTASEAQALLEYSPGRAAYPSCHRHGVRSRAWGEYRGGFSLKVARCVLILRNGLEEELQPAPDGAASVVPTFTPSHMERLVSTRASASSVERRQRAVQEVPMQYNLCNEPWLKYTMQVIADRGLKPSQLTSARLHKEVLYLETARQRFEISLEEKMGPSEQADPEKMERYTVARCKKPHPLTKMRKLGIPLPASEVEVLESGLLWEDLKWGSGGLYIRRQEYALLRLHFTGIVAPGGKPPLSLRATPARAATPTGEQ